MNRRPVLSAWHFATFCALLALIFAFPALATDEIGIFWDTQYSQSQLEVPEGDIPAVRTGYLVLTDPSDPVGILGWECLVETEGPVQFLDWQLEGQSINVQEPPEFQVGIGGDPLPTTPDGILLASFQIYVTDYLPVTLSVKPVYRPSIPNQMAFIPAADVEALLPMGTATGTEDVAWINGELPLAVITPASLNFGIIPQGQSREEYFIVRNGGGGVLVVDASILGDCPAFYLIDYSGPKYLTANQATPITVGFTPPEIGSYTCTLEIGPTFDPFFLSGASREPIPEFVVTGTLDFHEVVIGEDYTKGVTVRNTGETYIPLEPALPPGLPDFAITYLNPPLGTPIAPGEQGRLNLTFTPTTVAYYDFPLDLGPVLPDVPVLAQGVDPVLSWVISPQSLDFGDVGPGVTQLKSFSVTNTGQVQIPMVLSLADTTLGFSIPDAPPTFVLFPGNSRIFTVWFKAPVPGLFQTELLLGDILPSVPLQANVPLGSEPCLVNPEVLGFGTVTVGQPHTLDVYVTNQQAEPLSLDPVSLVGYLEVAGGPVTLAFGESVKYEVTLTPAVAGPIDELVDLGNGACDLLQVLAIAEEPSCYVNEGPLDFGIVAVEVTHMRELQLQNPYSEPLTLYPSTDSAYFSVPPGPITIQPGQTAALPVTLVPPTVGLYEGVVDLGTDECEPVTCLADAQTGHCIVSETQLNFGDIPVGTATNRYVHVINDGPTTITLNPTINSPHFWTSPGLRTLEPGHTLTLTVYFQPTALGTFQVMLDLGADICQPVSLIGAGSSVVGTTDDRIGLYFDTGYTQIEWITTGGMGEVNNVYLVLNDPSNTSGVIAWECQFSLEGSAYALGWTLEGNNINVGDPSTGEFIVGIAQPLPWSPQVLLGTLQILSFVEASDTVLLSLTPVQTPSLEGAMAYIGADDSSILIPMTPSTGSPVVAIISGSYPTPVEMPAPAVTQTGSQVQLSWSLPQMPGDGCHVYRRDPEGREERLTAAPVAPEGKEFRFVDQPFGYANGDLLTYSYSAVTEGVEGVRSPGTEVRLSGVPAARTQLLANVPNPFNPSTEVHFQLDGTKRVHVSIYDVNGRLVRDLVDAVLQAGPHHRTWDGRDNGGRAMSSGAYYLRLVTDSSVDHRKMMLLK